MFADHSGSGNCLYVAGERVLVLMQSSPLTEASADELLQTDNELASLFLMFCFDLEGLLLVTFIRGKVNRGFCSFNLHVSSRTAAWRPVFLYK